jgi:hypothetical protein
MRALDFAMAYDAWLRRSAPSVTEPVEPNASDYGLEYELAEPFRAQVRRSWEADVMAKVMSRAALQKTS